MTSDVQGPYQLGRREEFDERSRNFNVSALFSVVYSPRSYTWSIPVRLNQGQIPGCVGWSWAEELAGKPKVIAGMDDAYALRLYKLAQTLDEWEGENYAGTSVLAGAKATQQLGHLGEYRWAFNTDDLFIAIGYKGPAVIGIPWLNDMFSPDGRGFIHPGGAMAGGHALSVPGVKAATKLLSLPGQPTLRQFDRANSYFRLHNHWTPQWGIDGDCFIMFNDLDMLLHQGGDACIPVKRL